MGSVLLYYMGGVIKLWYLFLCIDDVLVGSNLRCVYLQCGIFGSVYNFI